MAALSRQLNAFFAIYLPALCQSETGFSNTYTVFAGGDDFFLMGPWRSQIQLAARMRNEFTRWYWFSMILYNLSKNHQSKEFIRAFYLLKNGDDSRITNIAAGLHGK